MAGATRGVGRRRRGRGPRVNMVTGLTVQGRSEILGSHRAHEKSLLSSNQISTYLVVLESKRANQAQV